MLREWKSGAQTFHIRRLIAYVLPTLDGAAGSLLRTLEINGKINEEVIAFACLLPNGRPRRDDFKN